MVMTAMTQLKLMNYFFNLMQHPRLHLVIYDLYLNYTSKKDLCGLGFGLTFPNVPLLVSFIQGEE